MTPEKETVIDEYAKIFNIDSKLVVAICLTETDGDENKVRFEPNWKYLFETDKYASLLGITELTERSLQSHSWGIMQVMGSVAREEGYGGPLQNLSQLNSGLFFGVKKLARLTQSAKCLSDLIASYNAGSPMRTANGNYVNQNYVDRVLSLMK